MAVHRMAAAASHGICIEWVAEWALIWYHFYQIKAKVGLYDHSCGGICGASRVKHVY